jgi:hypothetical protein
MSSVLSTTYTGNTPASPVQVTAPAGFNKGSASQTPICQGVMSVADGADVYVVTTGKTFYLTGIVYQNASGTTNILFPNDANGQLVKFGLLAGATVPDCSVITNGGIPFAKYTTGTHITITTGVGGNRVTLMGWEE